MSLIKRIYEMSISFSKYRHILFNSRFYNYLLLLSIIFLNKKIYQILPRGLKSAGEEYYNKSLILVQYPFLSKKTLALFILSFSLYIFCTYMNQKKNYTKLCHHLLLFIIVLYEFHLLNKLLF